jgi:tetratricopeptide (TPR) repeat protein
MATPAVLFPKSFAVESAPYTAAVPYNRRMKLKVVAVVWAIFFLESLTCFSQSDSTRQQQIESHDHRAVEYLKANRPDLAIQELQAVVALDPHNVDARGNLGAILFFQGRYSDAIPQLRAALKMQPTLWKTNALLGMAEKRTGDYSQGLQDLEMAFPKIQEEKVKTEAGMELIELYSESGDLDKAASVIDTLSGLYPTEPQILYTSYRIHSDLAAQAMLSLTMVAPNSALMHQVMAHELAKQGDTEGAIRNYREALKIDPKLPGLNFELAEMLNTLGGQTGNQEARKEYQAALAVNPADEKSECRLGEIAYRDGNMEESWTHYSRAVKLQPDDPDANIGLARTLLEMHQTVKAQSLLEHAIQIDPTSAVAHFRLSAVYRKDGRMADAQRELQEYKKYKAMKEKLREIYQAMRLQPAKQESDESDARN